MIAHDICYPSGDFFDQFRILFECECTADASLTIGIGASGDINLEVWDYSDGSVTGEPVKSYADVSVVVYVFSDLSVAVAVPGQIVKAYPSFKSFFSHH